MLLHSVQTMVRDVKVKEKNKIIKVFGRSPQALYYLLQVYRRPRETTSIYCKNSKILARRAALLSRTISIFRYYHCLTK